MRQVLEHASVAPEGEGAAALDQALGLYPDFPPALMARATERLGRREIGPAVGDLGAYPMLKPRDVNALTLRAGIWIEAGDAERALADWNAVLEVDADNLTGLLNRGQVLANLERWEDASRDVEKVIAARPDLATAYYLRATCRERLGDVAGAADDLERALPAFRDSPRRAEIEEHIAQLRGRAR